MSFEIKQKTKVTVKIYGEEFSLMKPTVEQVEFIQSNNSDKEKSEKEVFDDICKFLEILGMPSEFSKKMEIDHLLQLIEYLSGAFKEDSKKK